MKKQKPATERSKASRVRGESRGKRDEGSYLSLNRQTYKPYLDADSREDRATTHDTDSILKFVY